ncbi:MAG TPA: hypothetical protein VMW30_03295 [Candidatus Paceibacterota bacterium]|nr:hypothetical protein [Candidatus Paceibacterota bacterium]
MLQMSKFRRSGLNHFSTLIAGALLYSLLTQPMSANADIGIWTKLNLNCSCQSIASSSDGSKLVTADNSGATGGHIFTSTNYGATWTPRESARNWIALASSSNGAKLVAAVQEGLIYTSTDSGATWTPRDSVRRWSGLASSSDGSKLVATVEGGWIYTSTDSGATWTARDSVRNWTSVTSSSDGTKLVATARADQIFTSSNSGVSWTPRDSVRLWRAVASSSDGSKLAAVVYGNPGNIYTSADSGATWTVRATDLNKYWQGIAMSGDGSKLVASSYTGALYTSQDSGATWTPINSIQSAYGVALSADGTKFVVTTPGYIYTLGSASTPTPKPSSIAAKNVLNGKCTKVGTTTKSKGISLKCVKVGKKLVWQKVSIAPVTKTPTVKPSATKAKNPCVVAGNCPIGSTGPGGGIVFYDAGSQQSWGRYLEAAPSGWSGKSADPNSIWCNVSVDVVATVTDPLVRAGIGKGSANTTAILTACTSSAAAVAHAYRGGGMQNWYLPSSLEAKAMYSVLWASNSILGGANIGKFNPNAYWTSTQADAAYAGMLMVDGTLSTSLKVYAMSIRPIRAF